MTTQSKIFEKLPMLKVAMDRNAVREKNRNLSFDEFKEQQFYGAVNRTVEFRRIENIPRRVLNLDEIPDLSPLYVREGSDKRLRPIQSAALIEASAQGGLLGMINVGEGKTLIALLLADAMEVGRAVYLVKPDLKKQLEREIDEFYNKHFRIPLDRITIVSYSELSSAKKADILEQIKPDLIIADEAHSLKHPGSARTKRFLRYMRANQGCRFVALSGTMTTRSVKEYAHLSELALRKNSPLPLGYQELQAWAGVLDVNPTARYHPGALTRFCAEGESVKDGFRRRLAETPGVVATDKDEIGSSLTIQPVQITVAPKALAMMNEVRRSWTIVDEDNDYEEEITEASVLWRVRRQIACGFYYVWDWPNGEPDRDWLEARKEWNREVRERLKYASAGMDSPLLLANAAERHWQWKNEGKPHTGKVWASEHWAAWRAQKDKQPPPVKAIWIDDFMVRAVRVWAAAKKEPSIIWYEHRAIGEALSKFFPFYGPGDDASAATEPVIVCSIRSQGTGKNLQRYCRNLFTSLPPNGSTFEQTVGRTHRSGQLSDEVIVDYFEHSGNESMDQILVDAAYVEEKTPNGKQRVLYATRLPPRWMKYD